MSLSDTLFNNLTNRLQLDTYSLEQEEIYTKNLQSYVYDLENLKEKGYKNFSIRRFTCLEEKPKTHQDFTITYIIGISFLKANTTIHISDIKGNVKVFYSAGSIGLTGKQKRKRRVAVIKLISLIMKRAKFLENKPIAVHLNNVNFYQNIIIRKLKQVFFIKIMKSYNQVPYNGCRKSKVRRKKYVKRFK